MAERSNAHVLGATLVGGMVGAGIALLFAPRSGKETRERISENASQMRDQARDKVGKAKARVRHGMDEAKDLKDRLTEAAHNTGKKAKQEIEDLQTEAGKKRQSSVLSSWEEEV